MHSFPSPRSKTHLVTPPLTCLILLAGCSAFAEAQNSAQASGKGVVFHDKNRNGTRDQGEPGIGGVRVSNGSAITVTDSDGGYSLDVDDDTILFVIKPRGWQVPMNELNLPQFYYIHKPAGSPPSRFAGVPPTGELPASVDFPLHPNNEPDRFEAILFGDTQPRDGKEVNYIAHDVVEDVIGTDAAFGVTMGDIVFDDLSVPLALMSSRQISIDASAALPALPRPPVRAMPNPIRIGSTARACGPASITMASTTTNRLAIVLSRRGIRPNIFMTFLPYSASLQSRLGTETHCLWAVRS